MTSRPRTAMPAAASILATLLLAACSSAGGAAATAAPSAGGGGASGTCPTSQPPALAAGEKRTVTMNTPKGTIAIAIDGGLSPIAAGNFVALAACGFYDGVVFHRVVPQFVIQGGDGQYGRASSLDPNLVGTGGPGYTIKDEPVTTAYRRGTVAMARSSGPDTVGSQFFIVLDDLAAQSLSDPRYDNYQIIGSVSAGMDTVDAIAAGPNSGPPANQALEPVTMDTVTVSNP